MVGAARDVPLGCDTASSSSRVRSACQRFFYRGEKPELTPNSFGNQSSESTDLSFQTAVFVLLEPKDSLAEDRDHFSYFNGVASQKLPTPFRENVVVAGRTQVIFELAT